jgi:hypothetical protein
MKHKRKTLRILAIAALALVLAMALALATFCYGYYREGYQSVTPAERLAVETSAKRATLTGALDQEVRKASNAYLSVPEWFIVYISDDYASAIAQTVPSTFAYSEYLADYWRLYGRLAALIENAYAPDSEYHTMVRVIGVSTTVEFGLKAFYEDTVGHLFEWISGHATPEDAYAARVARDYVSFIRLRPWYEFEFRKALVDLWTTLPAGGDSLLRKLERRAILSAEYTIKWGYASLIEWATHAAFGVADIDTYVRLSGDPEKIAKADKRIRVLAAGASADAQTTAIIPRYQPFTEIAPKLTANGGVFRSIAGQDFVTVGILAPAGFRTTSGATVIASTPVHIDPPTGPRRHRLLYWVAAGKLGDFLSETAKAGGTLEHVYDF